MNLKKSEIYGIVWTIVAAILLFLLLWFCSMSFRKQNEGGLEVNFGDVLESSGLYEPAPAEALEVAETPAPQSVQPTPPKPAVAKEVPLQSQDFEESLAVREAREKERQRKEQERIERAAQAERERLEQERLEEERRVAAEKAKRVQEISNRAKGAFSGSGSSVSASEGTGNSGSGNEGNPFGTNSKNFGLGSGSGTGSGNSVGSSFSLGNRKLQGALPRPSDNTQVVGKIVVEITVDASGKVISAVIGQGTNITESSARNAAIQAAKKAKFTAGERTEIGIITYNYVVK